MNFSAGSYLEEKRGKDRDHCHRQLWRPLKIQNTVNGHGSNSQKRCGRLDRMNQETMAQSILETIQLRMGDTEMLECDLVVY